MNRVHFVSKWTNQTIQSVLIVQGVQTSPLLILASSFFFFWGGGGIIIIELQNTPPPLAMAHSL